MSAFRLSLPSSSSSSSSSSKVSSADHVAAYLEYRNIVGDDDNGRLFTPREFEDYKRTIASNRLDHRLYSSWRHLQSGMDCRQIGPASLCFCQHRYRQHNSDAWEDKRVHCKVKGCPCALFDYLPIRGSEDVKCSRCRHSVDQHDPLSHHCSHTHTLTRTRALPPSSPTKSVASHTPPGRCPCEGFLTSRRCSCGGSWAEHRTVYESREERVAGGRPVDGYGGTMYQAMGGLTGFTSLIDGVDLAQVQGYRSRVMGRGQARVGNEGEGAALALCEGNEQKVQELRRGKMQESDEMALYEKKYHKTHSIRSRTGLQPATPRGSQGGGGRGERSSIVGGSDRRLSGGSAAPLGMSSQGTSRSVASVTSSSSTSPRRSPLNQTPPLPVKPIVRSSSNARRATTTSSASSAASSPSSTPSPHQVPPINSRGNRAASISTTKVRTVSNATPALFSASNASPTPPTDTVSGPKSSRADP